MFVTRSTKEFAENPLKSRQITKFIENMARSNKITYDFTDVQKDAVLQKITDLKLQMPFLVNLTMEERKKFKGIGNKNVSYVQKCLEGAQAFPNELKKNFDTTEFKKDVNLFNNLLGVQIACQSLLELIDDSMKAAGVDAMGASSEVYASLKSSAKSNASVKNLVAEIAERFKGQGVKKVITVI